MAVRAEDETGMGQRYSRHPRLCRAEVAAAHLSDRSDKRPQFAQVGLGALEAPPRTDTTLVGAWGRACRWWRGVSGGLRHAP